MHSDPKRFEATFSALKIIQPVNTIGVKRITRLFRKTLIMQPWLKSFQILFLRRCKFSWNFWDKFIFHEFFRELHFLFSQIKLKNFSCHELPLSLSLSLFLSLTHTLFEKLCLSPTLTHFLTRILIISTPTTNTLFPLWSQDYYFIHDKRK